MRRSSTAQTAALSFWQLWFWSVVASGFAAKETVQIIVNTLAVIDGRQRSTISSFDID
jgi:hypothetical protein